MQAPVPKGDGSYDWINLSDRDDYFWYFNTFGPLFSSDSLLKQYYDEIIMKVPAVRDYYNEWSAYQNAYANVKDGQNPNDINADLANQGITPSPEFENYISNATSQYNTGQAQNYETSMRDSSILSSASQLSQVGLSPSVVGSIGGVSSNGVGAAYTMQHSGASLKQQASINSFNQKMNMSRAILGMVGQMASSGIYGSAIGAAKKSASVLAGATAHSGLKALQSFKSQGKFKADEFGKYPDAKIGGAYSLFE